MNVVTSFLYTIIASGVVVLCFWSLKMILEKMIGESEHNTHYVIEGMYWFAGDSIYIDTKNDDGYTVVCLNDFIKREIEENSIIKITIDIEDKSQWKGM